MNRLLGWWYALLRKIDLKILWPACVDGADDLEHAKAAFAYHAFNDSAWLFLGHDGIVEFIDNLEAPENSHVD